MNTKTVLRILGLSLLIEGALMLLPIITALIYSENPVPFIVPMFLMLALGTGLTALGPGSVNLYARDGFVAVTLVWFAMSAFGALPFVISGDIPSYIDALFETVSGFTTTGASVVSNVEQMSRSCLFWRSFTHWIGGMGVLVFIMAVLPLSGEHSMHIMRAEVPGPIVGKLVPRAKDTAKILYLIYAGLTIVETVLLMFGGMSFFEALLHAFGTAGTGGFSTRSASVGAYDSVYIELVIAVFLVVFSINFNLYYLIGKGRIKEALSGEELKVFLATVAGATLLIAAGISGSSGGLAQGLRHAFFNVTSIVSTAGFCTVDYTLWPQYTQTIIVMLMFCGACAGSTGGGIKVSRIMILFKDAAADIGRMISPRRVKRVRIDGRSVPDSVVQTVCSFFFMYLALLLVCTLIVSLDGFDFSTSFTASLSCISNVGPGLSLVGPTGSFAIFSGLSKAMMIITMLAGRLEIYPMIILLMSWKRR